MITEEQIKALKDIQNKVFFVALPSEVNQAHVIPQIIYTGIGKMRAATSFEAWLTQTDVTTRNKSTIINVGTASSAKHPIGELFIVDTFNNGGSDLVAESIEHGTTGISCYSSDFFVSTQTFPEEVVEELKQDNDFFDMESFALAKGAKTINIKMLSIKIVSDNLDGTIRDLDETVNSLRPVLEEFINKIA